MGNIIWPARFAAAGGVTDPNFSSVKLLMGFESSIVDESASPHTATVVGNAARTTSQSKFGSASATFDGTGDRITFADSADWQVSGSWTIEGWFRFLVKQDSQAMLGQWDDAGNVNNCAWFFYISGGNLRFRLAAGGATNDCQGTFAPTLGSWYHLACDRDGSICRIYVNGSFLAQSGSMPATSTNSTAKLVLGAIGDANTFPTLDFNGQMDEIRITQGVARYATGTSFTVPSAAFPRS